MIESGDVNTAADLPSGDTIQGVFLSGFNASLDINGSGTTFRCSNTSAALVSIDSTLVIKNKTYTVREKEQSDRVTVLILETT